MRMDGNERGPVSACWVVDAGDTAPAGESALSASAALQAIADAEQISDSELLRVAGALRRWSDELLAVFHRRSGARPVPRLIIDNTRRG